MSVFSAGLDLYSGDTAPAAPTDVAIATLYARTVAGVKAFYWKDSSNVENPLVNGVGSFNGRTGAVTPVQADYDTFFVTPAEGAAAYDPINAAAAAQAASQPLDATLTALAAANWAANTLPIGTGVDALSQTVFGANTFPARASTGNLVAKPATDYAINSIMAFASAVALTAAIVAASASASGAQSIADKNKQDNFSKYAVNLNDFGVTAASAPATVMAAVASAVAALPSGGIIMLDELFPISGSMTIATAGITFKGANANNCGFTTNSATADMFLVNQWFVRFETMMFATSVNRTAGYCINSPEAGGYSYTTVFGCKFYGTSSLKHYNIINMGATLMDIDDIEARFFANNYIEVNGQSDHRITRAICDNAVQSAGGIVVIKTASLLVANCNIIHAGQGMDIVPLTGGTIPSIKALNSFFDNCTNGLRFNPAGTGVWYRSQFVNCWFSSATGAGVLFNSAQFDGIDFSTCDFLGNAVGIDANTGGGKWGVTRCRVAGNSTAGIRLAASASHFPTLTANQIGSVSAFGVNAVGVIIGAGTYTGLILQGNDVTDNTSAATLGAVTVSNWARYRICDNPGINPKGTVTTPSIATSTTAMTNTTGYRVTVYLKGGTVTVITVNGVALTTATLATYMSFQLDPGGTIAITYSVVPTSMVWAAN